MTVLSASPRARKPRPLARYLDTAGRAREVIALAGAQGTVLVLDRDRATLSDRRVVAHLGADEPFENARVVCASYMDAGDAYRARCRSMHDEDLSVDPFASRIAAQPPPPTHAPGVTKVGVGAAHATLAPLDSGMSIPELRWLIPRVGDARAKLLSLRDVIAAREDYEPACAITASAIIRHREDPELSIAVLRAEFRRVQNSPIVLNRRLRERVLTVVERGELSMSEIALRCGRIKRDASGNRSGEQSWLARRLGLLPDAGQRQPTPWVHSDVLALIAREGLGVSPREVELGLAVP
jgi:hypothetical protein